LSWGAGTIGVAMDPDSPQPVATLPRPPRWPYVLSASFLVAGLAVVLLWPVKLPYYAISPGPVEDVADLITVTDAETFESDGKFYLLTVGLREVNAFEWVEARFFDSRVDLLDRDVVRPPGVSQEQVTRTNLEAMNESIDTAIFVALERLGYDVTFIGQGVEVLQVVEGTPAFGVIEVGDRFDVIAGKTITTADEAGEWIRTFAIGDTITLEGTRGEEPISLEITLAAHPDVEGAPMVGVLFDTVNLDLDLPIDVTVDSRNIGGPSAGMTYALTIIDVLTPGDLTKGHVIAGTGTIRFDETVGAIGGVRQKVFAARAVGAEIIFVPQDNYADALTAAGDGVLIVPITTLQEALDYLEALEPVAATVAAP
jgi:PDZ domain-containing protein